MKILLTGGHGKLSKTLLQTQPASTQIEWFCPNKAALDLSRPECVQVYLAQCQPQLIIHTAAYTQVDAAEDNAEYALTVNARATEELARWAGQNDVEMLYVSTDYVFDGAKQKPYLPQDEANPLNAYGRTKWLGEKAIQANCSQYWVMRSGWLHHDLSRLKNTTNATNLCFAQVILSRLLARCPLSVVDDQVGTPTTYTALAEAILRVVLGVLKQNEPRGYGVYHVAGSEVMSWHGLAQRVADYAWEQRMLDAPVSIQRISTFEWEAKQMKLGKTLAQRPLYSALQSGFHLLSV